MFNADDFMNQPTEPLATKFEVCPEGEFKMQIDSQGIKAAEIKYTDRDGNDASFHQLEVPCVVLDDKVRQTMGRDKVIVRMSVPLDLDENGKIAVGPNLNVKLGQLRDVLDQNKPGWKPGDLVGAGPFMGKVVHRADKKKPDVKYADVVRVGKIS